MSDQTIHKLDPFSKSLSDRDLQALHVNLGQLLKVLDDLEVGLYHSRKIHGALQRICKSSTVQESR